MTSHRQDSDMTRRRFIQTTAFAVGASALSPFAAEEKSRIFEVHRPGVINKETNRPDAAGTQEMLDRVMQAFTGEKSRRDQWAAFVTPKDVVGLKVNGLGGPQMCTKHELIRSVIQGLLDVGVPENNIIVWENNEGHMKAIGLDMNTGKTGFRVYHSGSDVAGHDEKETTFPAGSTHLSKILTEQTTVMINMPILKDHAIAGSTLSLKNISHGITDNPGKHHANGCDPFIAEINALEAVQAKHRLIIMDALRGCFDGGPGYKGDEFACNWESILVSTDRVAMDTLCTERIEARRKEKGLPTLAEAQRPVRYLATAEKLGLGNNQKDKIEHKVISG
ncbi:MAG TPA: DUF362 domain-containing protein [bacterium]|nr:DUF362 domain-containing protein [bacterium]